MSTHDTEKSPLPVTTLEDLSLRLNAGEFDNDPAGALESIRAVIDRPFPETTRAARVSVHRWLVALFWTLHLETLHGESVFRSTTTDKTVVMPVSPDLARLALASNIEGALTEKFGAVQGEANAFRFYTAMLKAEPGKPLTLSTWGVDVLNDMYENFAQSVVRDGIPSPLVKH